MIDLTPQMVSCNSCGTNYVVDPELIPTTGARVVCRRCGSKFTVYPPGSGRASQKAQHDRAPSLPPENLAPRRIWVFPDDPALQREGVLATLRAELVSYRVQILDGEARQLVYERATANPSWPNVLVFGDLHVLVEDRLLQRVATRAGVHRILVSTHYNPELIQAAREFCGFDRHLTLPLTPSQVREALGAVATRTI